MTDYPFDKRQTNIAKGVATLLLLWHHLFYAHPNVYKRFTSLWMYTDSMPMEAQISRMCKVCVATFLLLSGYGLLKSWESRARRTLGGEPYKMSVKQQLLFVKNHLIKLMSDYWLIFVIFVPMGLCFGFNFWEKYQHSIRYAVTDFFGLAYFFNTPTMNDTWWFMSAIIVLYLIFPLLMRAMRWSPEALVVVSFIAMKSTWLTELPYVGKLFIWIPPFVLGMYFAHVNGLARIERHANNWGKRIVLTVSLLYLGGLLKHYSGYQLYFDSIFALAVVLFCYLVVSRIPFVRKGMEVLGSFSGLIFMFHTFIYHDYFRSFIYGFRYAPLIMLVLTLICLVIAVGLKYLKKLIRYDKLVALITK